MRQHVFDVEHAQERLRGDRIHHANHPFVVHLHAGKFGDDPDEVGIAQRRAGADVLESVNRRIVAEKIPVHADHPERAGEIGLDPINGSAGGVQNRARAGKEQCIFRVAPVIKSKAILRNESQ